MLSDLRIRSLKPRVYPDGTKKDRWVSDGNGLYLRVRATGGRSWVLRRKSGNITLDTWPTMSLAQARIAAGKLSGKQATTATLGELLETWYEDVVAKTYRRPKDVSAYFDRLDEGLKNRKLRQLQRLEVRTALKRYADKRGPVAANRLLSILKTALAFAVDAGYIETSPIAGLSPDLVGGAESSRERVLTDGEIKALWHAESPHAPLLKFLLLTGARIGEAQKASAADIRDGKWYIPAEHSKNGRAHWIALSKQARAIVDAQPKGRDLLFGSATNTGVQAWLRRWCEREKIDPAFTPHDLRRTCATRMADLGVMPHVVEKILNHTMQGVMAVYNRAEYEAERVEAMQKWASNVMSVSS